MFFFQNGIEKRSSRREHVTSNADPNLSSPEVAIDFSLPTAAHIHIKQGKGAQKGRKTPHSAGAVVSWGNRQPTTSFSLSVLKNACNHENADGCKRSSKHGRRHNYEVPKREAAGAAVSSLHCSCSA